MADGEGDEGEAEPEPAFDGPAWQQFSMRLNELAVAHSFAVRGLAPQRDDLMQFVQGTGAHTVHITPAPPWKDRLPSYGEMPIGDIPSFLGPKGAVEALIGHMWLVTVNTEWEVEYRARIAADLGMSEKDDLRVPIFGDLCHFRNDIVHHRGIASKKETERVEVLTDWSTVDELIMIDEHKIVSFMDKLGLVKWEGQDKADEFLAAMKMADAERKRLGVEKIVMSRAESDADAAADVVQCAVCKQRSKTDASNCPKCGAEFRRTP